MSARPKVRRIRALAASLTLAIATVFAASGLVAAANPNRTFDVSACATPNGKNLILTVSWSGVPVSVWSYFIESTEGSGGVLSPVPAPGDSGTFTETFGLDVDTILSVEATIFRPAGPNYQEVATTTLNQPASGWPRC